MTSAALAEGATWDLVRPFAGHLPYLWTTELPAVLHDLTDTNGAGRRSRLRLYEDGRELGPGHALHDAVRLEGGGRYSFWRDTLYFSTPDGSDPNVNGRRYCVVLPKRAEQQSLPAALQMPPVWVAPTKPIRCTVLGMGNRGYHLASMAQGFAGVDLAWVVDISDSRLRQARKGLGQNTLKSSKEWSQAVLDPEVDAVFITLPDFLHRTAAELAFRAGKHVYLEKPVATSVEDARAILAAWQSSGRTLQLGYVLRRTPFYGAIKDAVAAGLLGSIRMLHTSEQLDVKHGASFMRRWHADSVQSGGLIVHKCCHDLDLICWMFGTHAVRVASFGGSNTFARPAPARFCSQCTERPTCPFADDGTHERRTPEERANPTSFGLDRCVFRRDKDIIDNQVVAFELANGVRGSHHLTVQGRRTERRITITGDHGRLDGVLEDGCFTIEFASQDRETFRWSADGKDAGSHMGGDKRTLHDFLDGCAGRTRPDLGTPDQVMAGLEFAIAAETARKSDSLAKLPQT